MKLNADHYFTGKNRHRPCEDYAVSGTEPVPYAILADGCSASPGSHTGAMLLALSARREVRRIFRRGAAQSVPDYEALGRAVIRRAARMARLADLPETALDATLMTAFVTAETVIVHAYGDGFIIAKRRGKPDLCVAEIRYETNAPYYLSYQTDRARNRRYGVEMDGAKVIQCDGESLRVGYDAPVCYRFPVREFSLVALASDGLASFADKIAPEKGLIPATDMIREFTAFRNFNGQFVRRRARRAVTTCEKRGVVSTDDISVAAIYAEEETP
ncbi:Uncharacterized protein DENIS_3778 [Desulfonema ishimotonii]|uniref:PPM-type phosphatase domain-containing protein n=2 Tax=Desulfonema ishimotonii TaxID=45657 RepID=A0A401G0R2_9BACT|nr:Uncharacterized protein DENIS_3778 [Desulfonema ishimotonii]